MSKMAEETKNVATVPAAPAYLQKFMQQSMADAASMAASSMSVPRLSFRGKRFRFISDGDEELVKGVSVNIIILGIEPPAGKFLKTFYAKDYAPGDNSPPDCSSSDGLSPDNWVANPVNPTCQGCPKNVFGSATSKITGKATKACKDGKRAWVARPENPTKFFGLNIPVTSLKNLSDYGKYIGANQFPLSLVITELGTADDSEFPKLTFTHVGFLDEAHVDAVVAINEKRPWNSDFANVPLLDAPTSSGPSTAQPQPAVAPKSDKDIDAVISEW